MKHYVKSGYVTKFKHFQDNLFKIIILSNILAADVLCCTASIYSVLVISIDRYIGITRPLKYNSIMTKRRLFSIITIVWTLSLIISLTPKLSGKSKQILNQCEVNQDLYFVIFSASISFWLPLVIILFVYFRIYLVIRTQMRFLKTGVKKSNPADKLNQQITLRIHKGGSKELTQYCKCDLINEKSPIVKGVSSFEVVSLNDAKSDLLNDSKRELVKKSQTDYVINQKKKNTCPNCNLVKRENNPRKTSNLLSLAAKFKSEQKAALTPAIVVGCFTMSWMPFFLILSIGAFCKSCNIPKILFQVLFWMGYCNSAMNPLIYALSSTEFRRYLNYFFL